MTSSTPTRAPETDSCATFPLPERPSFQTYEAVILPRRLLRVTATSTDCIGADLRKRSRRVRSSSRMIAPSAGSAMCPPWPGVSVRVRASSGAPPLRTTGQPLAESVFCDRRGRRSDRTRGLFRDEAGRLHRPTNPKDSLDPDDRGTYRVLNFWESSRQKNHCEMSVTRLRRVGTVFKTRRSAAGEQLWHSSTPDQSFPSPS